MCFEPRILYYYIEPEVYISYFDGNKNVKAYLQWETKLDQIFKKYQVDEFRRFSQLPYVFKNMLGLGGHKGRC